MTITANYTGASTVQITTQFTAGQSASSLTTFMQFANTVADAIIGTAGGAAGANSGITFTEAANVTAQTASDYTPTPSTNSGWTLFDSFWGGQNGLTGRASPIFTQVFRSVNKDGVTAKNIVLRYNIKEQVVNTTTYQYWDTQANYDAGTMTGSTTTTTATGAVDVYTIVVGSATGLQNGDYITGTGIAPNTTVTAIVGTSVTISNPVKITLTGNYTFTRVTHAGNNEAWTFFDSAPIAYNLTACDFIINVSPRWCLLHSYVLLEPSMWAGVFETAREDIMDTVALKTPCWGWISSTLWCLGAVTANVKPFNGTTNPNDYPLICMPKTRVGNSGIGAARGWGADYGITASPTWSMPTAPNAAFIYYLGSGGKFQTTFWDATRRLTLPIKPIADFNTNTVTNYGQIFGLKVLAPVGQNMNKINIAVDSDGNSSTSATEKPHWILNCHHKTADTTSWLTAGNTTINNTTWGTNAKPNGMVVIGSMLYYFCADRISRIDTVTGINTDIITGQSGYSDIKFDGERYVYVTSTTAQIALTKLDICADNIGTTQSQTYASGGASGQSTFLVGSATGIVIGQSVSGTGVSPGAVVLNLSGTTVTLSANLIAQAAGTYLFTNTGIIHSVNVSGGYSAMAINGDSICCARAGAVVTPIFDRYVRQSAVSSPAALTAAAVPTCTVATTFTETTVVRDMTSDFEGNIWAAPVIPTTTSYFRLIKIDAAAAASLASPSWTVTAGQIYPATLVSSVGIKMLDGNNLYLFGCQTAASTAPQYIQYNPRSLTVIANAAAPTTSTATSANTAVDIHKIQGNLFIVPKNSAAAGNSFIVPLGRAMTNVLNAPIFNLDVTTPYGHITSTFNTPTFWDGTKLFFGSENNVRYFTNFNGGVNNGGNPTATINLGQITIPA